MRKRKKPMPSQFPATSLSWAAIPPLEPEQAVSHVWTGMRLRKPGGDNQNFKRDGSFKEMGVRFWPSRYNNQDRENQVNCRRTDEWIQTMGYIHTIFLNNKEIGNNAMFSQGKESRDDHSK